MDLTGFFTGKSNNSKSSNNKNNKVKHHYFIGCKINDEILIEKLELLKKKLINKYKIQEFHYPNLITTNLIYLGYFDHSVAVLFMDKIIRFLCQSVTKKFSKLQCNIKNFKMVYDGSYNKIMLQLEDENSYLLNTIIPFLQKSGIEPIYGSKKFESKASIDMIYFKKSDKIDELKQKFKKKFKIILDFPIDTFILDSLVLIQGTPLVTRSGLPSTHDQMNFKIIKEYEYKFNEGANNINKNLNKNGNKNNVNANVNRNNNNVNRNNNNVNKNNANSNRNNANGNRNNANGNINNNGNRNNNNMNNSNVNSNNGNRNNNNMNNANVNSNNGNRNINSNGNRNNNVNRNNRNQNNNLM